MSTLGQKFSLDTPRTDSSLRRGTENLLNNLQESTEISQYVNTPGADTEKPSTRVSLLDGIAQWSHLFYLSSYSG